MPFERSAISALLFDLDGTLIDSTADLAASSNWLREHEGMARLPEAQVASYVGDGAEALVRRLLERPDGDVEEPLEAFKRHYHEHCLD
ncbi:MAG TPA: HAD hydrolase-like protein, partial [bacterium]|nr:HAD hydrolase-like protein [bacterium]